MLPWIRRVGYIAELSLALSSLLLVCLFVFCWFVFCLFLFVFCIFSAGLSVCIGFPDFSCFISMVDRNSNRDLSI